MQYPKKLFLSSLLWNQVIDIWQPSRFELLTEPQSHRICLAISRLNSFCASSNKSYASNPLLISDHWSAILIIHTANSFSDIAIKNITVRLLIDQTTIESSSGSNIVLSIKIESIVPFFRLLTVRTYHGITIEPLSTNHLTNKLPLLNLKYSHV